MKIFEINSIENEISKISETFDNIENNIIDNIEETKNKGFVGKAFVYEQEIFINTFTGEGYELVLKKMKSYIDWYSGNIRLAGFDREDIKQLICLILFDGIRRYNPRPGNLQTDIKLSTFLYIHIKNRIISRIKEETRQSLNASLNEQLYTCTCLCGESSVCTRKESYKLYCKICNKKLDAAWKIRAWHYEPISLDAITTSEDDAGDREARVYYNGKRNNFIDFFGSVSEIKDVEHNLDFSNILNNEDKITSKIAKLIYNNDYSITDAAKEVGLTCWAASLRLKRLKNNKLIKELFINK